MNLLVKCVKNLSLAAVLIALLLLLALTKKAAMSFQVRVASLSMVAVLMVTRLLKGPTVQDALVSFFHLLGLTAVSQPMAVVQMVKQLPLVQMTMVVTSSSRWIVKQPTLAVVLMGNHLPTAPTRKAVPLVVRPLYMAAV